MSYCYNLESLAPQSYDNLYGVCLDVLYKEGQTIFYNGYNYKVWRSVQNFFKQFDNSGYFLGYPTEEFQMNPTEEITWSVTGIEYNGVAYPDFSKSVSYGAGDYQNYKSDAGGFEFYANPWDDPTTSPFQNQSMFIDALNDYFYSQSIPIKAVMYSSTEGNSVEMFCLLMRQGDSLKMDIEKEWLTHFMDYSFYVYPDTETIGWTVEASVYERDFTDIDGEESTPYAFRSQEKCPCSDETGGYRSYSLRSCDEKAYPSKIVCATSNLTWTNPIVFLTSNPTQYYTIVNVGVDVDLCEEWITQSDLGMTPYRGCRSIPPVKYYEFRNCATGKLSVFGVNPSTLTPINEPCGECEEDYEETDDGFCERVLTEDAIFNGSTVAVVHGDVSTAYGWGGARFYQNITGRPFPIVELNSPYHLEDDNGDEVLVVHTEQGAWDNSTGTNGRLNLAGVKASGTHVNEWLGFTRCIDVHESKVYYLGIGADDQCRIKINGELIVSMLDSGTGSHTHWHIFPITLSAGVNIIEMEYRNTGSLASFGAEIYDATEAEIYGFTTVSEIEDSLIFSTKDTIGTFFTTGDTNGWSCPTGYSVDFCAGGGDPVCTLIERIPKVPCEYEIVRFIQFPCDCFQLVKETTKEGDIVTVDEHFASCDECMSQLGKCEFSERTLAYSIMVKLPEPPEPDRGFKECCYDNLVLASLTSNKYQYNDFNGFYFQKQLPSDSCDFVLIQLSTGDEFALDDATYGVFKDFGDYLTQPDLTTYKVEWRKVLALLGTGLYQIKKEISIAGLPFTELSNTFHLEQFTNEIADKTVRLDSVMDGQLVHLGVDFKGTGFTTSIRTEGFFGNRNPEYEQDNLVKRNYDTIQISMSQKNEYQYQTGLLPVCITEQIYDFMLFGNKLIMNDYNLANHKYYSVKAVELSGNKGAKYYVGQRDSRINLTFTDREKDKRKLNC